MPIPLAIGIGAGIAAGISAIGQGIAAAFGAGRNDEAEALMKQALDEYGPGILPKLRVELQNYNIPESKLAQIGVDQQSLGVQQKVLAELERYGLGDATDNQMTLGLMQAQDQANQQFGSSQKSILEQIRNSGNAGRLGVAAQQNAAQQAANMANRQGLEAAAMAEQRKMRALNELGGLSTNMRNQSFQERSQAAKAQDELNKLNMQMSFDAKNQYYNQVDADFRRKMQFANARAGVYGNMADQKLGRGQREGQQALGIANTVGNTVFGAFDMANAARGGGQAGAGSSRSALSSGPGVTRQSLGWDNRGDESQAGDFWDWYNKDGERYA